MRNLKEKIMSLVFAVCLLPCFHAALVYSNRASNATLTVPAFRALPWELPSQISSSPLVVIPLHVAFDGYNPCDKGTFNADYFTARAQGQKWLAVTFYTRLSDKCGHIPLYFLRSSSAALTAQQLGASAMVTVTYNPDQEEFIVGGGVKTPAHTVNGIAITIPAVSVLDANQDQITVLAAPGEWQVLSVSDDYNWYRPLMQPTSAYRIWWWLQMLYSIALIGLACWQISVVLKFYQGNSAKNMLRGRNLRLLILVPELLGLVARVLFCIDPVGLFKIVDFLFTRSMLNLTATMGTFAKVVMIFYCYDVYRLFKSSRSMQKVEGLTTKYPWIEPASIVFAMGMVVADTTTSLLSLNGLAGANSVVIPALYQLLVNFITAVCIVKLNCLAKEEIKAVMEKEASKSSGSVGAKSGLTNSGGSSKNITVSVSNSSGSGKNVAPASTTANKPTGTIAAAAQSFNLTRMYMLSEMVGLVLGLVSLSGAAANLILVNPTLYGIIMSCMVVAVNICTTFQLLAAGILPAGKAKSFKSTNAASSVETSAMSTKS